MQSLRWTLLILGVVFVALLAWWERRRPRQASDRPERSTTHESFTNPPAARMVRDPPLTLPEMRAREPLVPLPASGRDAAPAEPERGEALRRELPVIEVDEEIEADEDASSVAVLPAVTEAPTESVAAAAALSPDAPPPVITAPPPPVREALPELPAADPPVVEWPPDRQRRILALRLVAPLPERFAGRSLRQALAAEGFVLGQFAIFHKPNEERRAVLSAASLTRPGTFDMETMDSQHYGGLSLFAVLPGPKSPPQAFDELVFTARNLNDRLHGVLQDEQGSPLTPARIALLREQLRGAASS